MKKQLLTLALSLTCATLRAATMDLLILDPLASKNACVCVRGHAQRDYDAFAARLGQALTTTIQPQFGAALTGTPAIIIGKQTEIESGAKQSGRHLTQIAMLTDTTGSTNLHGLFLVRRDDPAKTIADLHDKKILFGPAGAAEKNSAALAALQAARVPLPAKIEFRNTCTEAAAAVAEQQADAAVISDYALPLLEGCKIIGKGELKIVGRTADVPFIALYVTSEFPAGNIPQLQTALRQLGRDKELCQKMESTAGFILTGQLPAPAATGWPDWRGPGRTAQSDNVPAHLPATAKILWRKPLTAQSLGGVAATESVVIVSDKSADLRQDFWRCLDAATGEQKWQFHYPAAGKMDYTSAPRATPVIKGDRVYLFGALGHLHCVALRDGALHWHHNLLAEFHGELPTWGFCATPLIVNDRIIVPAAAKEALLVAFDRQSGRLLWQTPGGRAGYGNFICADSGGGRQQVIGCDTATAGGWDATDGRRLWTLPPPCSAEFKVPTPVMLGNRLLLAGEQTGTRLHACDGQGRPAPKPVAQNLNVKPNITSPVLADGFIWLTTDEGIYCLNEALTVVWKQETEPFTDAANLIAGNHHVLVLTKNGTVALLPAKPDARTKPELLAVFPATDNVEAWSQPALVGSRLYVRTDSEVLCLSLAD